ncbi:MAG: acyl-CoA thioesterase [Fimbriimonadaceae bacterium]
MAGFTLETLRVRYGETDAMGHAYYGSYMLWFEQARGAWCRDRGFTYKGLEERGLFLPVVELHVRYRAEILYDDLVTVKISATEIKRASLRFDYEVFREDGRMATEGYTWHVFMGHERKAVTIPPDVREMLGRGGSGL